MWIKDENLKRDVKELLMQLKDTAYDADDLLHEFRYQILRWSRVPTTSIQSWSLLVERSSASWRAVHLQQNPSESLLSSVVNEDKQAFACAAAELSVPWQVFSFLIRVSQRFLSLFIDMGRSRSGRQKASWDCCPICGWYKGSSICGCQCRTSLSLQILDTQIQILKHLDLISSSLSSRMNLVAELVQQIASIISDVLELHQQLLLAPFHLLIFDPHISGCADDELRLDKKEVLSGRRSDPTRCCSP